VPPEEHAASSEKSAEFIHPTDSINRVILGDPDRPDSYVERAWIQWLQGDSDAALDDYNLAIEADSMHAPAWEGKSELLFQLKAFDPAVRHLDECIDRFPSSTACRLRRAEIAAHLHQYDQAFELLGEALRTNDLLHEAYYMKGQIYEETGADEKALSSFKTAIEVAPDFYDGYVALGLVYARKGDPLAREYYRSAIELEPRAVEARYNFAIFLQEQGDFDDAFSMYNEILFLDENNATACFNQGYIHLEYLTQYDSAAHWFSEAIARLPHYRQAFFNRGLAYESLGDTDLALADYDEALRLHPGFTAAALAKNRVLEN
jgi:tetratricopeptide (TPR) repeat protein